jgi:hypothetical protein
MFYKLNELQLLFLEEYSFEEGEHEDWRAIKN